MKLLCINTEDIITNGITNNGGAELKEGEIYTTRGKPCIDSVSNLPCYYIDGIGRKLCCRFTELLDEPIKKEESIHVKAKELCLN
jgi:hypothetical protein